MSWKSGRGSSLGIQSRAPKSHDLVYVVIKLVGHADYLKSVAVNTPDGLSYAKVASLLEYLHNPASKPDG